MRRRPAASSRVRRWTRVAIAARACASSAGYCAAVPVPCTFTVRASGAFGSGQQAPALELDADASGFDLYKKSGYSLTAAEGVFDLLDYADQPFDQLPSIIFFYRLRS